MCSGTACKQTPVLGPCLLRAAGGDCPAGDGKPGATGDGRAVPSTGLVPALPSSVLCSYRAVLPPRAAMRPFTEMLVSTSVP